MYVFLKDNFSTVKGRETLYSNFALCLHDKTSLHMSKSFTVLLQEINDDQLKTI